MGEYEGRRTPLMNLWVQVSLRVLSAVTASASMGLMITSREAAFVDGGLFNAFYDFSSSFRYLAYAYALISPVTLSMIVWVYFGVRKRGLLFFLIDFLATLTAISVFSAAMSESYTEKHGHKQNGWLPICRYVHGYCNRVTLSLAMSFANFLFLFILSVITVAAAHQF